MDAGVSSVSLDFSGAFFMVVEPEAQDVDLYAYLQDRVGQSVRVIFVLCRLTRTAAGCSRSTGSFDVTQFGGETCKKTSDSKLQGK